jgi:hypothetical protein
MNTLNKYWWAFALVLAWFGWRWWQNKKHQEWLDGQAAGMKAAGEARGEAGSVVHTGAP